MLFTAADFAHMSRALALAQLGRTTTAPNPCVGCVLVRDGVVVGSGWHRAAGEPHAEVLALRAAAAAARGATCYVTLEPCDHHGRTPPCTTALLDAGIVRVVAAMEDPNPLVRGAGLRRLRAAGVDVAVGLLAAQSAELNRGFCRRMSAGLPWVTLKSGMTLDGRTATAAGESRWITSAAARADVQRLRAASTAILTGVGTVLADDPRLDVRDAAHAANDRQPLRVVVDSTLRTPAQARVLALPGRCILAHAAGARPAVPHGPNVELLDVGMAGRMASAIDLERLLRVLGQREVNEVLVESGPGLAGALLAERLVDEIVCYVAPRLLGDAARGLATLPELQRLDHSVALEYLDVRRVGSDLRIVARPAPAERGGA